MKRLRLWLSDFWHCYGWALCSVCQCPFRRCDAWNPRGTRRGHLTCSIECCAKADGRTVSEVRAEILWKAKAP